MNLAELLTIPASIVPDQEIIRFEGRGLSYASLEQRVAHIAGAFQRLGVERGDRVAVLQTGTPTVLATLYATASVGGVFVPLNYRARDEELRHMLSVATPRLLLVGARYLEAAQELAVTANSPPQLLTLDPPQSSIQHPASTIASLSALARDAQPLPPREVADDDLAVLLFTSGTTAAAKAVMLAHADLANFVLSTTELADGTDRGAVVLAAPLYHVAGLSAALAATFAGRRIVLMQQFEAGEWLCLVAAERASHAFLVPTMLKRVLDHPSFPDTDLSSLQVLSSGSAPMPLGVIRRAIAAFPPGVQFINAFGQTETTSTVTVLGPEDHRLVGPPEEVERKLRRLTSIGRPLPEVQVRILDEQGQPVLRGQVGEIALRAERLMRGYYGQEQATRETLRNGWLLTRDLGWMDEDGYLYLAGRKSDLIIRGGENIAPQEIEAVLETHPAVEEAAVIGVPDEEWGERVAAFVVRRSGAAVTADDLVEFCRQRLASFKKPELVVFIEALPRNALGKVLRNDLKRELPTTVSF